MNINEISIAYLAEKEQRRRASTVDDPSIALVGRNPSGSVPTTRSLLL